MAENYRVDRIRETITVNTAGDTEKIYKVRAIGPGETAFNVDIPEKDFTPEKVAQVLTDRAANIEKIREL